MDPIAVLRTLWQYRLIAMPIVLMTFASALYVFQFAPRFYESSATYALINPDTPTEKEILANPELGQLNDKNPYLRSSDPSLIVQVLLTRMNDSSMPDKLQAQKLGADYTVSRGAGGINGFLINITGVAETPEKSFATTRGLGNMLEEYLYEVQKVNGADDPYLFTPIVVTSPEKATEQFSSRLRSLIAIFLAGAVLMFGAVAIARSVSVSRTRAKAPGQGRPAVEKKRRSTKGTEPLQGSAEPQNPSTVSANSGPAAPATTPGVDGPGGRQRVSGAAR